MRTIKFRGKVDGRWWYATPEDIPGDNYWEQFWALVDKKTVGEYTGKHDDNGCEIYHDDLVETKNDGQFETFKGAVAYQDVGYRIMQAEDERYNPSLGNITITSIEVIGNIHDNPEMRGNQ